MKRRAQPFVPRVDIQSQLQEESRRDWLITLSSNMKHIDATRISHCKIASVVQQVLNQEEITKERCKMHSSETVVAFGPSVDPIFQEFSVCLFVSLTEVCSFAILQYMRA